MHFACTVNWDSVLKAFTIVWSWPTVALVLFLYFRVEISTLITKLLSAELREATIAGINIEFPKTSSESSAKDNAAVGAQGTGQTQVAKEADKIEAIIGRTYGAEVVRIDGKNFTDCKFDGTILEYAGGTAGGFQNCSFSGIRISFVDAAGNTMNFLKAIYHGFGEVGEAMVNTTFENIKARVTS
jgi:hypothetical protein